MQMHLQYEYYVDIFNSLTQATYMYIQKYT